MVEIWHKTCQKQALFTSFQDFSDLMKMLLKMIIYAKVCIIFLNQNDAKKI